MRVVRKKYVSGIYLCMT